MKEVTKQRKRGRNSKESFAKMNKDRKVKDCIRSKMVQANPKIAEKLMKKSRGRKAESSSNKREKGQSHQDLGQGLDARLELSI